LVPLRLRLGIALFDAASGSRSTAATQRHRYERRKPSEKDRRQAVVLTGAAVRKGRGNGLQPRHVLLLIVPPRPELSGGEARVVGRVEPVTQRDDAADPVRTITSHDLVKAD